MQNVYNDYQNSICTTGKYVAGVEALVSHVV